jgi:hypothetical protein
MTLEQITAVTIGMTFNAATFVLGVLVGCSLKRKEAFNGDCDTEGEDRRHHAAGDHTAGGSRGCRPGCAEPKPEADPAKHPSR